MAVRFDAVGDQLNRTANLPPNGSFTYMMWAVIDNELGAGTYQPYLWALDATSQQGYACGVINGIFDIECYNGGVVASSSSVASRPTAGQAACIYVRCSGTGANLINSGYRLATANAFVSSGTATLGSLSVMTQLYMGGLFGAYWIDGRRWNIKVWDRALSDAEILTESYFARPQNPTSLNFWLPLYSQNDVADRSGNGRNPTVVGTLTAGDSAGQFWNPRTRIFVPSAAVVHAATGALVGQGSTVAGSAARTRAHGSTGALTGQGSTVVGSARHNTPHAASGDLVGPGSTVSGSANRTRTHESAGDLVGPGSTVVGAANRTRAHASSGALTGPGSEVSGTAARTRQHDASGVLTGPGSVVVGAADHQSPAGVHDATGALVGQGSVVVGTAARKRTFASSGALVGSGSVVAGAAARVAGSVSHDATGVLVGPGSVVSGSANRAGPAVSHNATGALVGQGSVVFGLALNGQTETELLGGGPGGPKKKKRVVRTELDKDSYLYRLLSPEVREQITPEVAEVIEAKAVEVVEQKAKPSPKAVRNAFADEGIAYRQAYKEIYLELIGEIRRAQADEEEEEEAIAMALIL